MSIEEAPTGRRFETVRHAAPYAVLPRESFSSALELLSGAYASTDLADFSPRVMQGHGAGVLCIYPETQRFAVPSSGTIPGRGMFPVTLPEGTEGAGWRRVGELDRGVVYGNRVDGIVTLGASSQQIREIANDHVIADRVNGRSSCLPF